MKSVQILYANLREKLPESLYHNYLRKLPYELQEKNKRFVRRQDRYANLFGKLLLQEALKKNEYIDISLEKLKYNKYKRPYFNDNFDFNISHASEYVVCAFSKEVKLGIDIEKISDIDFSHFDKIMTSKQWLDIKFSQDQKKRFYEYWTMKESIIKADGRGLSIPLIDIVGQESIVQYDNISWYLNRIEFDKEYTMCLATSNLDIELSISFVDFYQNDIDQ